MNKKLILCGGVLVASYGLYQFFKYLKEKNEAKEIDEELL